MASQSSSPGSPASRAPGRRWLVWLALAALLHAASFDLARQPILTDVGYYLHFARRVAAGAVPYVDFVDYKTPLSMFAGALFVRTGSLVGLDPLLAIRAGYLLLSALACVLSALVVFRVAGSRRAAAWATLLAWSGFELLGRLPSIGNVPKTLVLVAGVGLLLAVGRRAFAVAGACAVVAGLDWQPGGFLAVLTLGVVLAFSEGRGRALLRATLGGLAAGAPLVLYFLARGGLGAAWEQTVVVPLAKPAAAEGVWSEGLPHKVERLVDKLTGQGLVEPVLGLLAAAGLVLLVRRVLRSSRDERPLRAGLLAWTLGIAGWTLYDFQGMADLFLLEGGLALLAGLALGEAYALLAARLPERGAARRLLPALTALLLLALVRPSFLAGGLRWVGEPDGPTDYDLADQREVAAGFAEAFAEKKVACLTRHELLVLGGFDDAVGIVFWHYSIHDYRGRSGETSGVTLTRLLDEAGTDVVVLPDQFNRTRLEEDDKRARTGLNRTRLSWLPETMDWLRDGFTRKRFASADGTYLVKAWVRDEP